jgi:parvulin-like peptidyl-prolyl isomerase
MKTRFFCLFFLSLPLLFFSAQAGENGELIIHNRILANVNGKAISVVDVMKKMDVFLARAYPQHASSVLSRYQFFSQNWRDTLNQMVDNELIIADAEKLEIKITDAEIREKIHDRFGPNIMSNLDQLAITLDEAWHMIYAEIAVQRMSWYRVHSKAIGRVSPQYIKDGYEAYLTENPAEEAWKYQVLSIRGATDALGSIFAKKAQALIRKNPLPFETLAQRLKEDMNDANVKVTLSEEYQLEDSKISQAHKNVLCNLAAGEYSHPISQTSRHDKSVVHRIFFLKEHKVTPPKSFNSMVDTLYDQLVIKEVNKEFPAYLWKLRKQFNYEGQELNAIPSDFTPFELKTL